MAELAFYCIPASHVADEAFKVSNAVYFSKWYLNSFPSLKAPLLLMHQNSQTKVVLKVGNIVTFNADTVVKVLQVVWSACSIIRGLRQN
ncbi:hypothetical protein ILUMI_17402 [Ignelater luminosus]|uniref:Uncharacterized protein n=1 Tax=Ignelater luminosus TaxID=2038154 RepID=A0A8K0CR30_IGNLU|nr:hypothetical protein ILUMI_17402 [Ignelater luminosus]